MGQLDGARRLPAPAPEMIPPFSRVSFCLLSLPSSPLQRTPALTSGLDRPSYIWNGLLVSPGSFALHLAFLYRSPCLIRQLLLWSALEHISCGCMRQAASRHGKVSLLWSIYSLYSLSRSLSLYVCVYVYTFAHDTFSHLTLTANENGLDWSSRFIDEKREVWGR